MAHSVEIEFKTLIKEADYLALVAKYCQPVPVFFNQTNTYFDTPDFSLKSQHMGLRIRTFDQRGELTLKSPLKESQGLLETTDYLTLAEAQRLIAAKQIVPDGHVATFLKEHRIDITKLVIHGQLTTKRVEVNLRPDVLLVLDESWYHGQHDFELEMEVTDEEAGQAFFVNFLKENQLSYLPGGNKVTRTFNAKLSK